MTDTECKPGYCKCGTKLLTRFLPIGKCAKCQYNNKDEYDKTLRDIRSGLLGVTDEEKKNRRREVNKRYRAKKKEQKQNL